MAGNDVEEEVYAVVCVEEMCSHNVEEVVPGKCTRRLIVVAEISVEYQDVAGCVEEEKCKGDKKQHDVNLTFRASNLTRITLTLTLTFTF